MNGDESTFWVMVMNYAICAVVIVAWVGVIGTVIWELSMRKRQNVGPSEAAEGTLRIVPRATGLAVAAPSSAVTARDAGHSENS